MLTRQTNMKVPRILVVDDEAFICELFREVMEDEGWQVDTAMTFAEAVALFERHTYDLVTLDCRMPEGNGVSLHQQLSEQFGYGRRMPLRKTAKLPPILFITGDSGGVSPKEIFMRESVAGLLDKPIDLEKLVRVVGEHLAARA